MSEITFIVNQPFEWPEKFLISYLSCNVNIKQGFQFFIELVTSIEFVFEDSSK